MTSDAEIAGESSGERRFFLAGPPRAGQAELVREDQEHALRVLRVQVGETLLGLDGQGRAWPLEVTRAERRDLGLAQRGGPLEEPRPGDPGSPLPWIEVALPLPRPTRQPEMIDRLTQLGVSRIRPVLTQRSSVAARGTSASRLEKLRRAAREACKQSRRLWEPVLEAPLPLAEAAAGELSDWLLLEPGAKRTLLEQARQLDVGARPTIVLGPEGGFTDSELEWLRTRGVHECRLTPTILRIETAAELAVGTLVQALAAAPR